MSSRFEQPGARSPRSSHLRSVGCEKRCNLGGSPLPPLVLARELSDVRFAPSRKGAAESVASPLTRARAAIRDSEAPLQAQRSAREGEVG